jgi:hypothetical protein
MYYDVFQILGRFFCQLCVSKSDNHIRGQHATKSGHWTTFLEVFDVLPELLMEIKDSLDMTPCHLVCNHKICWDVLRFKCVTCNAVICDDCIASVIDKWMSMERWRNDGCGAKLNWSEKRLSLSHVAHLKSHNIPNWHSVDTVQYLLMWLLHYGQYCHKIWAG